MDMFKLLVGCAQHRHKYLGLRYLAGTGIHDGNGLAGVVHKELVAGLVGLAHGALQLPGPGFVLLAEGAVLVGLTAVLVLVLLPQQMRPKCLICMRIYPNTVRLDVFW